MQHGGTGIVSKLHMTKKRLRRQLFDNEASTFVGNSLALVKRRDAARAALGLALTTTTEDALKVLDNKVFFQKANSVRRVRVAPWHRAPAQPLRARATAAQLGHGLAPRITS